VLEDPASASLGPIERALAGLASIVTEAPWTISTGDLERARAAGLADASVLHAIVLSAFFNYLNRVADAIDLEFDYVSALPRIVRDAAREPVPRPPRSEWPQGAALPLRLGDRAITAAPFAHLREYVFRDGGALPLREREVMARAVSLALCDARGESLPAPEGEREQRLSDYAEKLTVTPWRLTRADLDGLRALGLDDAGLLDAISVASFQNIAARLHLAITV